MELPRRAPKPAYSEHNRKAARSAQYPKAEPRQHEDPVPNVQELVAEIQKLGLDDEGKKKFVAMMWEWMVAGTEKQRIAAARILARGFISEKIDVNKPEPLRIAGVDDGLKRMLGEDASPEESVQ